MRWGRAPETAFPAARAYLNRLGRQTSWDWLSACVPLGFPLSREHR